MAVGDTITKTVVAMTGASVALAAANPGRRSLVIANPATNAAVTVDISGGDASAGGINLQPGDALEITGMRCKLAMTAIGTAAQSLTVYAES